MARYGRDFDRDRWSMRGDDEGMGGEGFYGGSDRYGSHWRNQGGWNGGEGHGAQGWGRQSGGMGSDAQDQSDWNGSYHRGRSGFGTGGGSYDMDYGSGWAGNPGGWRTGGLTRSGYGGDYYSGSSYGYDTGGGPRDYGGGQSSGRDWETGGGMGNDWGARDTGWGGGTLRGGGPGGRQQQDETRRMRAVDIMTENPECVTPEMSLSDAAQKMRDLDVGIIPVVDSEQNRRLRGVVTDRDIAIRAVAEGMDARSTKVSEVMTTEVESCNKNDTVGDILRLMEREQVRRVPITDREGRLVGIVAQADVVRDVDSERGEHRVNDALEQISEPTHGGRGGMMRGSQSRGGYGASAGRPHAGSMMGRSGGYGGGTSGGRTPPRGGAEGTGSSTNQGSRGGTEFGSGSSNVGGGVDEGNNWNGGNETA